MKKRIVISFIGLFLLLASSGCGGDLPLASGTGMGGKELVLGGLSAMPTLNPIYLGDRNSQNVGRLVFDSLFNLDGRGKLTPSLASGYGVSADGLTYTIQLRPGVNWQDGMSFSSGDVAFTYRAAANPANQSPFWEVAQEVVGVQTPSPGEIIFTLSQKDVYFPQEALAQILIAPAHLLGGLSGAGLEQSPFGQDPVGTGPYRFLGRQGQDLFFGANPDYFRGKPAISRVEYRAFPEGDMLAEGVAQNNLTFAAGSFPLGDLWEGKAGTKVATYLEPTVVALVFNTSLPELGSAAVRRAISTGLDRAGLVKGVMGGSGQTAVSVYPPLPGTQVGGRNTPYNLPKAQGLLQAAGWTKVGGSLEKKGKLFIFNLLAPVGNPALEKTASVVASELAAQGFTVNLEEAPWDYVWQRALAGQFSGLLLPLDLPPGSNPENMLASWAVPPNGDNLGDYRNRMVDGAIGGAKLGQEGSRGLLQQLILHDPPAAFLYYPDETVYYSKNLSGYKPSPYILYNGIWRWHLSG